MYVYISIKEKLEITRSGYPHLYLRVKSIINFPLNKIL